MNTAEVQAAIADLNDDSAKPRLARCLPTLAAVLDDWELTAVVVGGLVLAAATPQGAVILSADAWPELDAHTAIRFDRGKVARVVATAIDSSPTPANISLILTGTTVLLGQSGLAAQQHDAAAIVRAGNEPLVVALLEQQDANITMLVATVSIPARVVH